MPYPIKGEQRNTGRTHFKKGVSSWNKGLKGYQSGEKNYAWKSDKAGYGSKHEWVKRNFDNISNCMYCDMVDKKCKGGRSYLHWANISGKYKRTIDDWIKLCVKCHKAYDMGKIQLAN